MKTLTPIRCTITAEPWRGSLRYLLHVVDTAASAYDTTALEGRYLGEDPEKARYAVAIINRRRERLGLATVEVA